MQQDGRGKKTANLLRYVWHKFGLKQLFAKLQFPLNKSFCKGLENIGVKSWSRQNMQVIALSHLSHKSVLPSSLLPTLLLSKLTTDLGCWHEVISKFNPLSPNIHKQILHTDLYIFP